MAICEHRLVPNIRVEDLRMERFKVHAHAFEVGDGSTTKKRFKARDLTLFDGLLPEVDERLVALKVLESGKDSWLV